MSSKHFTSAAIISEETMNESWAVSFLYNETMSSMQFRHDAIISEETMNESWTASFLNTLLLVKHLIQWDVQS